MKQKPAQLAHYVIEGQLAISLHISVNFTQSKHTSLLVRSMVVNWQAGYGGIEQICNISP